MTLPTLITPPGTAEFLTTGHDVIEDSAYAQWRPATGHSRARRVWTVTERVVGVEWFLERGQLATVEEWFETTLQVGSRAFSARIRNEAVGPLLVWWEARWIRIDYDMLPLDRAHVTGSLMLFGEGSTEPPEFGLMAADFLVDLRDIRSTVYLPNNLAIEFLVDLTGSYPVLMTTEFRIDLGSATTGGTRFTEDGNTRQTEDGQTRVIEG